MAENPASRPRPKATTPVPRHARPTRPRSWTVTAPPADAKIELGLSGYMNTYFSVASIDEGANDPQDFNPTGLFSDGAPQQAPPRLH